MDGSVEVVAEPATAADHPRIFSGIQPTGKKHLGNYAGGFRQYVSTQERGEAIFCIVDLHSITVAFEPHALASTTLDVAAMLIATGVDPVRSVIFVQSHNPVHLEAAWLLASATGYGDLSRMTQFKDKSEKQEFISAGLFTYPILMAADILLHRTSLVPVGDDQVQHLELTRDIARRFNSRFGRVFTVPDYEIPVVGARVKDLQVPERKMSTTGGTPQGTVLLLDTPDAIMQKFRSAVTDSGRDIRCSPDKPGITNLIGIMGMATGTTTQAVEEMFAGSGYGEFKTAVGEAVVALLEPIQRRYHEARSDEVALANILALGASRARAISAPTLDEMYRCMGFLPQHRTAGER